MALGLCVHYATGSAVTLWELARTQAASRMQRLRCPGPSKRARRDMDVRILDEVKAVEFKVPGRFKTV